MVVTQVEKDVVVNKVGKPEVKPRIVALNVFRPAKCERGGCLFGTSENMFEPANEKVVSRECTAFF